jgi:hypothetical protein
VVSPPSRDTLCEVQRETLPWDHGPQFRHRNDDRLRRIFLLAARPDDGRFTEPTAATQASRPERVFMPEAVAKRAARARGAT